MVLADAGKTTGLENAGDVPSERVFSDPDAAIAALAAKLA
jgi:hypothetical protein